MSNQTRNILQISTSLNGENSQSSRLAARYVAAQNGARVTIRDLAAEPVPHLDGARFGAFITPPEQRTAEQNAVVAYSDALIAELKRADVIVLGLPLYNFGIPSQLKSWIDHVARAGQTFRYTANGPEGLVKGKKAYVFATRGGIYAGTALDTQTGYIRDFLRFIGVEDVEFVYAEGLAISEESREGALGKAQEQIDRLAA
ncbi:FMN-dependent NADH-azoreductase [Solimonas sp. K1W22B-7]|uniref:FMN-dependent NADH-azoreductase n=1 Tax=Solimonas sp. K1W22B-7 TaxID=2303331 RepID=UPI000E33194C|nr:NAD(P)H-dependent oxidoreductase [Solimonas sp. K1W22B-7]AXQ30857.1 FMN-dependent NADH-azoreductase [Solimonas sp. K1W22B-7]